MKKSNVELVAEFRALVDMLVAKQYMSTSDEKRYEELQRYEELLREMYIRGLEPPTKLTPKS